MSGNRRGVAGYARFRSVVYVDVHVLCVECSSLRGSARHIILHSSSMKDFRFLLFSKQCKRNKAKKIAEFLGHLFKNRGTN